MRSILLLAFITWQGSHGQLYGSLGGQSQINLGRTQLSASGNINADSSSGLTHQGSVDISQNPDGDSNSYGISGGFSNEVGLRFPQSSWWNRDSSAGNGNLGASDNAGIFSTVGNWADQHITGAENALTNGMQAVGTASSTLSQAAINAMNRYANSLNNRNRDVSHTSSGGRRQGNLNLSIGAGATGNYGNRGEQSLTTTQSTLQHQSQLTADPSHLGNGEQHAAEISIGSQLGNGLQGAIEGAGNFMDRLGNRLRQPAVNGGNILSNLGGDSPQAQRPSNNANAAITNAANMLGNVQNSFENMGSQLGNGLQGAIEGAGIFMDRLGNQLRQPAVNGANNLSNLGSNLGGDSPLVNNANAPSTNAENMLNNAQNIFGNAGLSTTANRPIQTPFRVPDAASTNAANMLGNVQNSFQNMGSQLGNGLQGAMEGASNFMDRLGNQLRQPAVNGGNNLSNLGSNLAEDSPQAQRPVNNANAAITNAENMLNNAQNSFENMGSQLGNGLQGAMEGASNFMDRIGNQLRQPAVNGGNILSSNLGENSPQAQRPVNNADTASTNVANMLNNAQNSFENMGSQLGNGLQGAMEGASNFMDRLGNQLRQPAVNSGNILSSNLGQNSPQTQRPFNNAGTANTNVANVLNNAQNIFGNAGLSTNTQGEATNHPTQTPFNTPGAASTNVANMLGNAQNSFENGVSQLGNSAQSTMEGASNFMDRLGNRLRQPAGSNANILGTLGTDGSGVSQQLIQRPINTPNANAASANVANILHNAQNIFGNVGLSTSTPSQDTNGPTNTGNGQGFFSRIANSGNRIMNNMRQVAENTAAATSALGAQAVDTARRFANSAITAGSQLLQNTGLSTSRGTSAVGANDSSSQGVEVGANGQLSVQSNGQVSQGPASLGASLSGSSSLGGSTRQSSTGTPSGSLSANGQVSRNPGSMGVSIGGSLTTNNSGLPSVGLNVNGNARVQPSTNTATQQSASGGFQVQFVPLGRLLGLPFGK